jgi:hypothetical protein
MLVMGEKRSAMEFVSLVKAMRAAQDAYFKAPSYTPEKKRLLEKSKELEKQADEWIAAVDDRVATRKQPELGM